MKRLKKPVAACVIASSLLVGTGIAPGGFAVPAIQAATEQAPQLLLLEESIVSAGVKQQSYRYTRMSKNNQSIATNVKVIIADLQNPNVKLDVMTGQDGQFTEKANVLTMTKETGAIAGINGDYFDMKASEPATLGPQVTDSTLMATPTLNLEGMYAFGITKENKPIIETFTSQGSVKAANGQTYPITGLNRVVGTLGNTIYMYTSAWGSTTRAKDATPHTEVLVVGGKVTQIIAGGRYNAEVPANGYILSAGGKGAEFIAANVTVGDSLEADSSLVPVNPNLKYTEHDLKMLIGGHTMLIIDGTAAAFTRDINGISGNSNTSRSAVGFTKDSRYVYMVTADHTADSVGPTLADFQKLLIQLGVWRAVNLDGGGSTTLVSRPLGEFNTVLANEPKDGTQRRVVNGLGVFTTASPAALKDFIVSGPKLLWKGQTALFTTKAYDKNYNPLDPAALPVQYKTDGSKTLTVDATGQAMATAGGQGSIIAYAGKVSKAHTVDVADRHRITRLTVVPSKPSDQWKVGDSIQLTLRGTLDNGEVGTIPSELVQWQQYGAMGTITGNTFTFLGFNEGVKDAMLVARFDGYSTPLPIPVPQDVLVTNFTKIPWLITPEVYPAQAKSSLSLKGTNNPYLNLAYDFTAGDGTADLAAYANFNGDIGIPIAVQPDALKLDVLGDGQGGRLRVEFVDSTGAVQRKTIAESVDWTGWKTITVDLKDFQVSALKRIYILSRKSLTGEIGLDQLMFVYPEKQTSNPASVQLTIGKKDVTVAGEPQQMDQAPIIEKERTFVPVRFVVDALGGNVDWDATDKKVTIRKGEHYIELWVGELDMIADGARASSDVPPIIRNSRTLLPLRLVSEQLGLNVVWDPATRGISIQES